MKNKIHGYHISIMNNIIVPSCGW